MKIEVYYYLILFTFFRFLPDLTNRDHLGAVAEKVEKLQQEEGEQGLLQKTRTIGREKSFLIHTLQLLRDGQASGFMTPPTFCIQP